MLKRILILLPVLVFINSVFAGEATRKMVSDAKKSVVYIKIYGGSGKERAQATGFFLGKYGYIVTNFHVIYDAANLSIETYDKKKYWIDSVVGADVDSDIAVFTVKGVAGRASYLSFAAEPPEESDEVLVIGNPLGLEFTVSNGIISAIREIPEMGQVYQTTAPISPGSSGSPVLDAAGGVIGVAVMTYKEGQNLNFVVPYTVVKRILKAKQVTAFKTWKKSGISYLPNNAKSLVKIGMLYFGSQKYQEAADCALKALKLDSKDAKAYYLAGIAFSEINRQDEAVEYMKKAIELDGKMRYLHNDLGIIYHEMNMNGPATEEYYAEIEANPDNPAPYCNLADVYLSGGTTEDALGVLKRGLINCENTAKLHAMLGLVYAADGSLENAMAEAKTAVKLDETSPEALYALGIISLEKDDRDGALRTYYKLKKIDIKLAESLLKSIYE